MPVPAFVAALVASVIVVLAGALVIGLVALLAPEPPKRGHPPAPVPVGVALALVGALAMSLELRVVA